MRDQAREGTGWVGENTQYSVVDKQRLVCACHCVCACACVHVCVVIVS